MFKEEIKCQANSTSSEKIVMKRKKELTPNSKASRKKRKTEDDEVEDSIAKLGLMHVSPAKTAVVNPSFEANVQEESFLKKDKLNDKEVTNGEWRYGDDIKKLPAKDIKLFVDHINELVVTVLYPKLDVVKPEKMENKWVCPENSCPIRADVRTFDFKHFAAVVKEKRGRKFDIIMMDPPWRLTTSNPTRGVCISYACLTDRELLNLPVQELQTDGFLFIWVINSKLSLAMEMFDDWGYKVVDSVDWAKMTVNRRLASGHGYYLQHAFETCLIGLKGSKPPGYNEDHNVPDVIYSLRRGQSQKPEEIYEYCEQLVKDGLFLEIFGRRNNLRDGWITIGNEI